MAVNFEEGSFSNDGNAMGVKSALLSRLMQTAAAAQVFITATLACRLVYAAGL